MKFHIVVGVGARLDWSKRMDDKEQAGCTNHDTLKKKLSKEKETDDDKRDSRTK